MTKLSVGDDDDDDDDDDDGDKVMCGCDSSRSYSVQELGDRDLLWQKKDFAAEELFGEIGKDPGKDQDLMKIPSESELCILWDKNNLGSYQLQRLS